MSTPDLPPLSTEYTTLPPRPADFHKGRAGHVAIVAGSTGMSGAAVLASLGALRSGAGLARALCPTGVQPLIAAAEPSLMTVPIAESKAGRFCCRKALLNALDWDWIHALAIGPGVGLDREVADPIRAVLAAAPVPVVVDADGLNILAGLADDDPHPEALEWWKQRQDAPTVVTPHPGEMKRLRAAIGLEELSGGDDATRHRMAWEYAERTGAIVVLKGHRTIVTTADASFVNTSGNPGMATGGMGDVLTGVIAALIAQGMTPFDAARLGVHAHGLAADRAAQRIGPVGYLASDIVEFLPSALHEANRPRIGFR